MSRLRTSVVLVAATAMAAGCTSSGPPRPPRSPAPASTPSPGVLGRAVSGGLVRADDCGRLLAALKRQARREVTAYGLPAFWGGGYLGTGIVAHGPAMRSAMIAAPVPQAAADSVGTGTAGGTGADGYSTTNNQEVGVDEPDLAKTDGRVLAVIRQGSGGRRCCSSSTSRATRRRSPARCGCRASPAASCS